MVDRKLRAWVFALMATALTALLVLLTIRTLSPMGWRALPVLVGSVAAVILLLALPMRWLPAFALAIYGTGLATVVAVPLPVPLTVLILLIWTVRRLLDGLSDRSEVEVPVARGYPFRVAIAIALAAWLLLLTSVAPLGTSSVGWTTSFIVAVLAPLLVRNVTKEAAALKRTWVVTGGVVGAYAIVESILGANVLYWALGVSSSQHWSIYRAEGPFGHPLMLGTFLAVAASLALGAWIRGRGWVNVVWAAVCVAGVIVTASRGPGIAVASGLIIAVAATVASRTSGAARRAVVAMGALVVAVGFIIGATPLGDRWVSGEAANSSLARDQGLAIALESAAATGWFGSGGGTSSLAGTALGFSLPIESSALQALVSIGVPGLVLLVGLVSGGVAVSVRARDIEAIAGCVAFTVAISGFNYLDDRRSGLVLLTFVLLIAYGAARSAHTWGERSKGRLSPETAHRARDLSSSSEL